MKQSELEQKIQACLEQLPQKFPRTRDALIPLLQFVQQELGYLPEKGIRGIAEFLQVPASMVYGVATFYAQFRFKPLGKNRITVCRGTACHVRGSARLLEDIVGRLGIKPGETTEDLKFSLETVACVGSCALAPVTVVNNKVYGKATTKKIGQLIEDLQGEKPRTAQERAEKAATPAAAAKKEPTPAAKTAGEKPAAKKTAPTKTQPGKTQAQKTITKKGTKMATKKAAKKPAKKAAKKAPAKRTCKKK